VGAFSFRANKIERLRRIMMRTFGASLGALPPSPGERLPRDIWAKMKRAFALGKISPPEAA